MFMMQIERIPSEDCIENISVNPARKISRKNITMFINISALPIGNPTICCSGKLHTGKTAVE